MTAQNGFRSEKNPVPLDYMALLECLVTVGYWANDHSCPVHMPRIGCGLAGGSWDRVESMIEAALCRLGVSVTVYDLPSD